MQSELSFRRGARARPRGAQGLVAAFLLCLGLLALTRTWWEPADPGGVLVEVRGDLPDPGLRAVDPPTVAAALAAAGADPADYPSLPAGPLTDGQAVVVEGAAVRITSPNDPLLVALPIDLDHANAAQLSAVPGLGRSLAERIVQDREANGMFRDLEDVQRVSGVGAATVERLRPFVSVPDPSLVDLNRASALELERLPGIGPVLAARIVVDRADRGPYRTVGALTRVHGIDHSVAQRLRGLVTVEP